MQMLESSVILVDVAGAEDGAGGAAGSGGAGYAVADHARGGRVRCGRHSHRLLPHQWHYGESQPPSYSLPSSALLRRAGQG